MWHSRKHVDFKYQHGLHNKWLWTETTCLHSNIKPHRASSFLCIQAMNVMLASWHTVPATSPTLCLAYMWQGHNRVLDNRPLIEWLAGSGIHLWSSVTLQPRVAYSSRWVSGCTRLWQRGKGPHCHSGNLGEVTEVKTIKITLKTERMAIWIFTFFYNVSFIPWYLQQIRPLRLN